MDLLVDILILLVVAKIGGEIAEHFNYPSIIGELFGGILVGPTFVGAVAIEGGIERFAYIGILLLMFLAGTETSVSDLSKTGKTSVIMAFMGVAVPFALGFGACRAWGYGFYGSLFVGTALSATSVGISVRVLYELGELRSLIGSTILGSAILDDIISVVLVTIISGAAISGNVSVVAMAKVLSLMVAFFAIAYVFMRVFVVRAMRLIQSFRTESAVESWALILVLAFAILAEEMYVAGITGSFVAGMVVARTPEKNIIITNSKVIGYAFFIPFFFASIGAQVDMAEFMDAGTLGLLIIVVAIVGKVFAGFLACKASRLPNDIALVIGTGMIPRMEVALVIGNIGVATGVLGQSLYSSIIIMAFATTLVTPPLLKLLIRRVHDSGSSHLL